jgi:hypothetical protein
MHEQENLGCLCVIEVKAEPSHSRRSYRAPESAVVAWRAAGR